MNEARRKGRTKTIILAVEKATVTSVLVPRCSWQPGVTGSAVVRTQHFITGNRGLPLRRTKAERAL